MRQIVGMLCAAVLMAGCGQVRQTPDEAVVQAEAQARAEAERREAQAREEAQRKDADARAEAR
ncbi:hypothetical protein, partial [Marilutibacter aestuarii]